MGIECKQRLDADNSSRIIDHEPLDVKKTWISKKQIVIVHVSVQMDTNKNALI